MVPSSSVSLSEEERDLRQLIRCMLVSSTWGSNQSPEPTCLCWGILRHATSRYVMTDTARYSHHVTPCCVTTRRYKSGQVEPRRESPPTSLYVPLRRVTRHHVAQRHAIYLTSLTPTHATTLCPQSAFLWFARVSEITAIIFPYSINILIHCILIFCAC
jgi:hypothetical protein